jgi:hypothetical protein
MSDIGPDAVNQTAPEKTPSPDYLHPSGRVMLPGFDCLSVAKDIIALADADELEVLDAAIRTRRWELGKLPPDDRPVEGIEHPQESAAVSEILERRSYEDGELVLEKRAYVRKDGSQKWRGPYWYYRFRQGGRQRAIYLGKTDEPEAKLAEKRA